MLVILVVILPVLCVLFATGTIILESDEKINSQPSNNLYSFGDQVTLSKLSSIKNYFHPGDENDFSKWFILENSDEYITLISGVSLGKVFSASINDQELKDLFSSKYNIDFGASGYIGALDKNDLEKYFNCSFSTLKCNSNVEWLRNYNLYGTTITANVEDNKVTVYNFIDNIITNDEVGIALYPLVVKMKILKSNLD